MPGLIASRRSRKNSPVVIEGSLNDLMVLTVGLAFWAVAFAHLSISVSLIGRLDFDNAVRVLVMFILKRVAGQYVTLIFAQRTNLINCQTRPRMRVLDPSTISAPCMPTRCIPLFLPSSTA